MASVYSNQCDGEDCRSEALAEGVQHALSGAEDNAENWHATIPGAAEWCQENAEEKSDDSMSSSSESSLLDSDEENADNTLFTIITGLIGTLAVVGGIVVILCCCCVGPSEVVDVQFCGNGYVHSAAFLRKIEELNADEAVEQKYRLPKKDIDDLLKTNMTVFECDRAKNFVGTAHIEWKENDDGMRVSDCTGCEEDKPDEGKEHEDKSGEGEGHLVIVKHEDDNHEEKISIDACKKASSQGAPARKNANVEVIAFFGNDSEREVEDGVEKKIPIAANNNLNPLSNIALALADILSAAPDNPAQSTAAVHIFIPHTGNSKEGNRAESFAWEQAARLQASRETDTKTTSQSGICSTISVAKILEGSKNEDHATIKHIGKELNSISSPRTGKFQDKIRVCLGFGQKDLYSSIICDFVYTFNFGDDLGYHGPQYPKAPKSPKALKKPTEWIWAHSILWEIWGQTAHRYDGIGLMDLGPSSAKPSTAIDSGNRKLDEFIQKHKKTAKPGPKVCVLDSGRRGLEMLSNANANATSLLENIASKDGSIVIVEESNDNLNLLNRHLKKLLDGKQEKSKLTNFFLDDTLVLDEANSLFLQKEFCEISFVSGDASTVSESTGFGSVTVLAQDTLPLVKNPLEYAGARKQAELLKDVYGIGFDLKKELSEPSGWNGVLQKLFDQVPDHREVDEVVVSVPDLDFSDIRKSFDDGKSWTKSVHTRARVMGRVIQQYQNKGAYRAAFDIAGATWKALIKDQRDEHNKEYDEYLSKLNDQDRSFKKFWGSAKEFSQVRDEVKETALGEFQQLVQKWENLFLEGEDEVLENLYNVHKAFSELNDAYEEVKKVGLTGKTDETNWKPIHERERNHRTEAALNLLKQSVKEDAVKKHFGAGVTLSDRGEGSTVANILGCWSMKAEDRENCLNELQAASMN